MTVPTKGMGSRIPQPIKIRIWGRKFKNLRPRSFEDQSRRVLTSQGFRKTTHTVTRRCIGILIPAIGPVQVKSPPCPKESQPKIRFERYVPLNRRRRHLWAVTGCGSSSSTMRVTHAPRTPRCCKPNGSICDRMGR